MAQQTIPLGNDLRPALAAAAEVLQAGGVVVFPTETVYGIGVVSGHAAALEQLRLLKGRDKGKPFQLLAADLDMAKRMGAVFTSRTLKLATNYWPGPLTLVVPDGTGSGEVGVRVPDSPFVRALCRELERPLVSSSANPADAEPPLDAQSADVFGTGVNLLVDGGRVTGGVPSTVVRCGVNSYEILRHGALDEEAIQSAWDE